jgi:hypothetical protein
MPGLFHAASEIAELFFPHPGFSLVAIQSSTEIPSPFANVAVLSASNDHVSSWRA